MQKSILLFVISFAMFSCSNSSENKETVETTEPTAKVEVINNEVVMSNYAVIWEWTTEDSKLVEENAPEVSIELTALWKKGVVENAYYDPNATVDKLDVYPNIAFFLRAESIVDAEVILNKLTIVQKGIASYSIYPVGTLWLKRNTDVINAKGSTNSYASVWTTTSSESSDDEMIKKQNDRVLELWKEGLVENVYFDIQGTSEANSVTDFVLFVNASSQEEAEEICNSFPVVENNMASFKIFPAGVFWMGRYEDQ